MNPALIRARQIKALYQREMTALNRNQRIDPAQRRVRAERLWQQSNEQINRIRVQLSADLEGLDDEERALLEPPRRPAYLNSAK